MISIFDNFRAALRRWKRRRPGAIPKVPPEFEQVLRSAKGVIHIGANKGQESPLYDRFGLPVLWVEADPETAKLLEKRIADYPRQFAATALLADTAGKEYLFHVADNGGQSSSLLAPKLHSEVWPEVKFQKTLQLKSTTLDELLRSIPDNRCNFDVLVMDTQGSELMVLNGSKSTLQKIEYIKTEACDFDAYEGCCSLSDLDAWLTRQGFARFHTEKTSVNPEIGSFYEVFYKRETPAHG